MDELSLDKEQPLDVSEPAPTPRFSFSGAGQNPMSQSVQTLNVDRAQKIIRKLTDDPSWLADPRTSHAANAVFSAASKVVGMNLQMERMNSALEAAKAKNSITKAVGTSLLKLANSGPDGAGIAARWYALGDDGKPLYENPANASLIFKDYQEHLTQQEKTFAPGSIEQDIAAVAKAKASGDPERIRLTMQAFNSKHPKRRNLASLELKQAELSGLEAVEANYQKTKDTLNPTVRMDADKASASRRDEITKLKASIEYLNNRDDSEYNPATPRPQATAAPGYKIGAVYKGGLQYLGGDINLESSWKKVQ